MREYNPKHHSRATFTNSRVKFVVLPVLYSLLPLLPDAAVVVIGVQSATIKRLPSGIFIFPVCPKLAAVVESTLAVCDDVRRGPGTGPGHTSGQVQISFFMSGKIVAAATFAVVPACCCYYFAQFSDPLLSSPHWQENVRKCLPAVREKRAKRDGE